MPLSDLEMRTLVDAWLAAEKFDKGTPEFDSNKWADETVSDWRHTDDERENLWNFVVEAYEREMPDHVFAILAAGALEDLLSVHGTAYIDRVEQLARVDPRFNRLLGGVWKNTMTDDVWQRVQAARNEVW